METVNYQCPACGGPVHFVGDTGKVQCDYCDSMFTPQEIEDYYAAKQGKADQKAEAKTESKPDEDDVVVDEHVKRSGDDAINEYLNRSNWDDEDSENLVSYNCSSCGAELVCDKATAVSSCPYCGNPTVVPGKMSDMLKPDYVIPFKLDKDAAIAKLKEYYKGKKFLAKAFREQNHIEDIQGVYVPFWLYDATGYGDATFNTTNVTVWEEGDDTVTKTDHYTCQRQGNMKFYKVPADGSERMPDAHMDAIEPFDYSEMVPFSIGYMPGYVADRYDVDAMQCKERALKRIDQSVINELQGTVIGYDSVSLAGADVDVDVNHIFYAMMPVWMLHTKWKDKDYLFAMNGQTGKMVGDLPVSAPKFAAWLAGFTVGIGAIIFAILQFAI